MGRKKTIEEVREYVESQGYELLSDEYVNNQTKLKIKCNFGHIFLVCWSNFYGPRGSRCPECAGNKKKTIENKQNH